MPVLQRKQLRRDLGTLRLRETTVGTTSMSLGANAALVVMDRRLAQPDMSGNGLYNRAWVRVASENYRVGTYNSGSGAFLSGAALINAIASGADFEVHERLHPNEMDTAIDETILDLAVRREIGIPSVDGALFYTLDGAASPNTILSVLNVYYFANPSGSLNRDRRDFTQEQVVLTATGMELRMPFGIGGSMQIVLDAILQLSLGASDTATINLPSEEVVLWGAAARCYDLLLQDSPGQQTQVYERRRKDAVSKYRVLAGRYAPEYAKKITFETPFDTGRFGAPLSDPLW